MTPEILDNSRFHSLKTGAIVLGISAACTAGLMTYALVKDSGATVADLGRDVWDGVKSRLGSTPENLSSTVKNSSAAIVKFCKEEVEMLDYSMLRHFRGDA